MIAYSLQAHHISIFAAGTVLYVGFFALGAGAVPGLIVPELNNARLRGENFKVLKLAYEAHRLRCLYQSCFWRLVRL